MLGPEGRKQLRQASKIATIGIEMGLAVGIGLFGGHWIDKKLDTAPAFLFIGLFFGLATGFKRLWDVARKHSQKPHTPDYELEDTGYDDSEYPDGSDSALADDPALSNDPDSDDPDSDDPDPPDPDEPTQRDAS